jgi:hypothetical protein
MSIKTISKKIKVKIMIFKIKYNKVENFSKLKHKMINTLI